MKRFPLYLNILTISFLSLALIACGGANGENASTAIAKLQKQERNSPYYSKIIPSLEGEFAGLNMGDNKEAVKAILPSEALSNESETYVYYKWEIDNHTYNLDLLFDEADKLISIDGYVVFFDDKGTYDPAAANDFYLDLKDDFIAKYGLEEEVALDDFVYIRWIFDKKDVEVGIDKAEVYWYIYSYENNN